MKTFDINFVSSMYISEAENEEQAEKIFWERMKKIEELFNVGICWTEINSIEESEE